MKSSGGINVEANRLSAKMERYGIKSRGRKRFHDPAKRELIGPTDPNIVGLRDKYRSEGNREDKYLQWREMQRGKSSYTALDAEETKVERHPLLVNTYMTINRENALSKDKSRQRLLNRRFNLDIRDIWLSNLRHIQELRSLSNEYTKAQGFEDYDDENDEPEDDSNNRNNWGLDSCYEEYSDRGLLNRRDIKSLNNMNCQIQSVSTARALHNAYHSTYMSDPKIVLDYKAPPTPILHPPPPEPPILEAIAPGVLLRTANSRVLKRSGNVDSAHLSAWIANSAAVHAPHASSQVSEPEPTDADVILYIDRLVPAYGLLPAGTGGDASSHGSGSGSTAAAPAAVVAESGIFWRLLAIRRGDGKSSFVIGKEVDIAEYVGALWLNDKYRNGAGDEDQTDFSNSEKNTTSILAHEQEIELKFVRSESKLINRRREDDSEVGSFGDSMVLGEDSDLDNVALSVNAFCSVVLVGKPGAMVPFCSNSAMNSEDYFCRLSRSIDIEIHISLTRETIAFLVMEGLIENDSVVISEETGEDQDDIVELVLSSTTMEIQQLLHIPMNPINNFAWWIDKRRSGDIWPEMCSLLRLFQSSTDRMLSIDFYRSKPINRHIECSESNALFVHQTYSIAQELLSRVVVQYDDESEGMSIFIPGAPGSLFTASVRRPKSAKSNKSRLSMYILSNNGGKSWEELSESTHCLSLQLNGGVKRLAQVPGACEYGSKGLWQKPTQRTYKPQTQDQPAIIEERTRAAAVLFRDPLVSSTNTVLIHMCVGIDIPLLFPVLQAWENASLSPPKLPPEHLVHIEPGSLMARPRAILGQPLCSPLDRPSATAMIFIEAVIEGYDRIPVGAPSFPSTLLKFKLPISPIEGGFRQALVLNLLNVDAITPTYIFGLTELGATFNEIGTNPRSIWKSNLIIREFVNRELLPIDYHYIIAAKGTSGLNDRFIHTIHLKGEEFNRLQPVPLREYDDFYREIQERRDIFNRQLALSTAIERAAMKVKVDEKASKMQLRRDVQRAFERKQKKATQTEKSWAQKFMFSTVIDVKGQWEKRRDDRTGLIFFHRKVPIDVIRASSGTGSGPRTGIRSGIATAEITEKFSETCQWEVPVAFEAMPTLPEDENDFNSLVTSVGTFEEHARLKKDEQRKRDGLLDEVPHEHQRHYDNINNKVISQDAFEQPREDWFPSETGGNNRSKGIAPMMTDHSQKSKPNPFQTVPSTTQKIAHERGGDGGASVASSQYGTSVGGLKSEGEFTAPTIDTSNLEHIAEQLVTSDELVAALARRLGLPTKQIVPASELNSVFSKDEISEAHNEDPDAVLRAPRDNFLDTHEDPLYDSDDDLFSDDEIEAGDVNEEEVGDLPADCGDVSRLRREKYRATHGLQTDAKKLFEANIEKRVPFLNFLDMGLPSKTVETNTNILGWKRLPRPVIDTTEFYAKLGRKLTQGPDPLACNTLPKPIVMSLVAPSDATMYVPESYTADYVDIFIPDHDKDVTRAVFALERQQVLNEQLSGMHQKTEDMLLYGTIAETTEVDKMISKQRKQVLEDYLDPKQVAIEKAIQAAKTSNIAFMEDALEEGIHPDTADQFGNSLLILGAQQGSKRMVKFLLRRGANINYTNHTGNTALHYCFAYRNDSLGHYLIKRGASDIITNHDGLTCYEGLNRDYIANADEQDDFLETASQLLLQWTM